MQSDQSPPQSVVRHIWSYSDVNLRLISNKLLLSLLLWEHTMVNQPYGRVPNFIILNITPPYRWCNCWIRKRQSTWINPVHLEKSSMPLLQGTTYHLSGWNLCEFQFPILQNVRWMDSSTEIKVIHAFNYDVNSLFPCQKKSFNHKSPTSPTPLHKITIFLQKN